MTPEELSERNKWVSYTKNALCNIACVNMGERIEN